MWSRWYLVNEKNGPSIKRYRKINGKTKWERYPRSKYKDLDESEVQSLLRRINVTRELENKEAQERYNFDHSFVKATIKEEFEQKLRNSSSREQHVRQLMNYLDKHVLDFFINKRKLPHPNFWYKEEVAWQAYLLNCGKAPSTLKQIVQIANRFIRFMHKKYPDEVQAAILEPLPRKKLADMQARRPSEFRRKLISEEDYKFMVKHFRKDLVPYIQIGYLYGLRVAEIYGLSPESVFKGYLYITRQVVSVEPKVAYGPLKNKQVRKIPYWYSNPQETYNLINDLRKLHPNTISDFFGAEVDRFKKDLDSDYEFHDLRRTFITRSVRKYHLRDVQLAAGHYDIKTTMRYVQDDRDMNDEIWTPEI